MKCLLVTTHPLSNSLCKQLSKFVENKLVQMGHEVTIEDLYEDNFQPLLTVPERETYYNGQYDSSQVSEYVNRLLEAEALILLFPTWWFGFPAMLKGWFDRVWGPGITYDHANDYGPIKPRLKKMQRVFVVTTLGSPWWVDRFVMWRPVKRVIKLALLGACARKSRLQYLTLYNSEKLTEVQINKFTSKIDKALEQWS